MRTLLIIIITTITTTSTIVAMALFGAYVALDRTPVDWLVYLDKNLAAHPKIETIVGPLVRWAQPAATPVASDSLVQADRCFSSAAERARLVSGSVPGVRETRPATSARTLRVGPGQKIRTVADAARLAKSGDTIEIDPGEYLDDAASWPQDDLVIRGRGGRALMVSASQTAEGKAIWVMKGSRITIENIGFFGARVPDKNGAGIRQEGGKLTIINSVFANNEMGILAGGSAATELEIISSEFCGNAVGSTYKSGDRIGHQIYIGAIGRFVLRDSYVHQGAFGHLVKSRAKENHVYNNRISDEAGGRASYELEFPNGGVAYVVGNIVQQSSDSENPTIVSFGAEEYAWPQNELYLVNNTLVDDRLKGGRFLYVRRGAVTLQATNNLLIGGSDLEAAGAGKFAGNAVADWSQVSSAPRLDYRLKASSRLVGTAVDAGIANGTRLRLEREYVHPLSSRAVSGTRLSPGALQELAQ
jgi:hypothetical protein